MRAISDRKLSEPFRSWIDGAKPLPKNVRLLPRSVSLGFDLGMFLILGVMFGGMGSLPLVLLAPWRVDPASQGWGSYLYMVLFFGAWCLGLWSIPLFLLRRSWITLGAWNDLRHGRLRQGVFLGPEGLLVRMEPNWCYVVPWNRFVVAKLFPPERSRDPRQRCIIIETLDGAVDFFAERLCAGPEEINRNVASFHPSWSRPAPMRADRQRRIDRKIRRPVWIAVLLFVLCLLMVLGSIRGLVVTGKDSPAVDVFVFGVCGGGLLLIGALANLIYQILSLKWNYWCPGCRRKLARVDEAMPAIHFYCPACNVEWDTGWQEEHRRNR